MTTDQIKNVEESWDYVLQNVPQAGKIFYDKLFELDPQLKLLFRNDIEVQVRKLITMLSFVISKLNNLESILNDVKMLGQRHKNYNVKPQHYTTVANALLWTLEKGLGDKWTAEMRQSWVLIYQKLSLAMLEGSGA